MCWGIIEQLKRINKTRMYAWIIPSMEKKILSNYEANKLYTVNDRIKALHHKKPNIKITKIWTKLKWNDELNTNSGKFKKDRLHGSTSLAPPWISQGFGCIWCCEVIYSNFWLHWTKTASVRPFSWCWAVGNCNLNWI